MGIFFRLATQNPTNFSTGRRRSSLHAATETFRGIYAALNVIERVLVRTFAFDLWNFRSCSRALASPAHALGRTRFTRHMDERFDHGTRARRRVQGPGFDDVGRSGGVRKKFPVREVRG